MEPTPDQISRSLRWTLLHDDGEPPEGSGGLSNAEKARAYNQAILNVAMQIRAKRGQESSQMPSALLIDPPNVFSPISEMQDFLKEAETGSYRDHPDMMQAADQVRADLAERLAWDASSNVRQEHPASQDTTLLTPSEIQSLSEDKDTGIGVREALAGPAQSRESPVEGASQTVAPDTAERYARRKPG